MSGSVFGSYSIADRLKQAVNTLEQTGSSLQAQARAMGQQGQSQGQGSSSRPQSPNTTKNISGAPGPKATANSAVDTSSSSPPGSATSPTKAAGHYISQAGDAFTGLRKSLHFARASFDGGSAGSSRPGSSSGPSLPRTQELKDIPHLEEPRPDTPSRHLAAQFGIGSDPSSMSGTPRPHSPALNAASIPLPKSPAPPENHPPPDPSNPATYPLPPSPSLSPLLSIPATATFADPLGASPSLAPEQHSDPPDIVLGTEEEVMTNGDVANKPPEDADKSKDISTSNGVGLRINGTTVEENQILSANGAPPTNGVPPGANDLSAMERRYEDLSQRFTTLLTQKHNADKILKELTPLEGGIADHEALEGWVRMMNGKVEMITEEMKRLQGQISLQGARMEEIRDTHRLEGSSQSEQITKLRTQLSTAETNLASKATELLSLQTIRADLTKAQTSAKEEEEKRTKAISLLKTVRMKLVKVEKEKEEIERDRAEERAERSTARDELEKYRADREREVTALRRGFEKELSGQKERHEKDLAAKKAAWELEMITTRASHAKDLSGKSTKVNGLEAIVKELQMNNSQQFEDIQSRQAEVESSRSELEALRSRTKDLEFQLREVNERCALLEDAAGPSTAEPVRGRNLLVPGGIGARSATPSPSRASSVEIQRLLAEAETRSESKLADLRHKIRTLETERNSLEEEWASKLAERVRELERSKRTIQEKDVEYAESLRGMKDRERELEQGGEARKGLERELRALRAQLEEGKEDVEAALDAERLAKDELSNLQNQISDLRTQLEESKTHATNLKALNKTLREELRKVQSSVQLMERQRNPGVGYWSSTPASGSSATVPNHVPPPRSGVTSPGEVSEMSTPTKERGRQSLESSRSSLNRAQPGSTVRGDSPAQSEANKDEEEVNLEYLRNVILQFLEHKEMRPNLVRVLSVILRFTPQELRRLNAKLLT